MIDKPQSQRFCASRRVYRRDCDERRRESPRERLTWSDEIKDQSFRNRNRNRNLRRPESRSEERRSVQHDGQSDLLKMKMETTHLSVAVQLLSRLSRNEFLICGLTKFMTVIKYLMLLFLFSMIEKEKISTHKGVTTCKLCFFYIRSRRRDEKFVITVRVILWDQI